MCPGSAGIQPATSSTAFIKTEIVVANGNLWG